MIYKLTLQICCLALRRTTVLASAAALCGTALFAPAVWAADTEASQAHPGFQFKPWPRGKAVPELSGADLQGNSWSLKVLRGQPVLINFWASWCEPCRAEMPSLQAIAEPHEGEPREGKLLPRATPQVLAVNFKESPAAAQRFVNQTQLRLPVLLDANGTMAKQWGVSIFPSTVLVGADGKVRGTVVGALDWTSEAAQPVLRRLSRE